MSVDAMIDTFWEKIVEIIPSLPLTINIIIIAIISFALFLYFLYKHGYFSKPISEMLESYDEQIKWIIKWGSIFLVFFSVGFVVCFLCFYGEETEIVQKNSLHVAYNYDFENKNDPTDIYPWTTHPENKSYSGRNSEEEAHFGNHSLRLEVDITDVIKKSDQFGGIGIINHEFSEVKAIKAWVLVPKSEQVRGITFYSHIIAFFNDSYGRNIWFFGEEEEIEPGIWTPIFLGVFYETDCENCTFKWDGTIDELYLNVYHFNDDLRYKGSIYFDGITIWK